VPAGTIAAAMGSPAHDVVPSHYENRPFYLVTLSAEPHGTSTAGVLTCEIDFQARRESFTGYSMDVWFMPKPPVVGAPILVGAGAAGATALTTGATALVAAAGGGIWPVVIYVAVICVAGAVATATATIRPDVEGAGRLHELAATTAPVG